MGRWLVLIHQIPPKPDYFRVKVRRRLKGIGAVALKNSVYVLPNTEQAVEDFQWLRRFVVDEGGEATLCEAFFLEGVSDDELVGTFRAQADAEYGAIIDTARAIAGHATRPDCQRLTRLLAQATGRDFFHAPRGSEAKRAVSRVEAALERATADAHAPDVSNPDRPVGAVWVTRSGVHVDRMASAWLIVRFIDPGARFKFVPAKGYRPDPDELRFDMFEGEYTHEGDRCTFETLLQRFAPDDAALRAIADVVHDIDCKDEKFGREETAGIASLVQGISAAYVQDTERIAHAMTVFDGLYAAFRRRAP